MLTSIEATNITKRCIRAVSNESSLIEDRLRNVGINTPDRLNAMIGFIVDDKTIGVRSRNHRINPVHFSGLTVNNTVAETRAIVRDRAVEVAQ